MMQEDRMAQRLVELDAKLNDLLPERYQHCYAEVAPTSMGSAELVYGPDGKILWDQIWTTFCDLALAGGPPHRGKLLEPVSESAVLAQREQYEAVVAEIRRAIELVTDIITTDGYAPGWVGVKCVSKSEATWLQFAITAENVTAQRRGNILQLPAGPDFRAEKEIKNVVVALAKSYHYWDGHLTETQQTLADGELWEPALPEEAKTADYGKILAELARRLGQTGLPIETRKYPGWIGVEVSEENAAVWLLRAVLVEQVLARREASILYLPVAAQMEASQITKLTQTFEDAWQMCSASLRK